MNNKSILDSIKLSIDNLNWTSPTKKQKALELCISIFNLYVRDGGDFYAYQSLSKFYFKKVIKTSSYVKEIKDVLINNSIIEVNESYNVSKGISKGYRFTNQLLNHSTQSDYTIIVALSEDKGFGGDVALCGPNDKIDVALCGPIIDEMDKLSFKSEVNDWINNFKINKDDIQIDNQITDEFVNIKFDSGEYRYGIDKALQLAQYEGLNLIKYNDKCYLDTIDNFICRKESDLKKIYKKYVFDINNKCFRASRNETNFRLDYNLTNMKSELLDFLLYEGEELVELDISNAQFAILSNTFNDLDSDFNEYAQNGKLYSYIENKLNLGSGEGKQKMFRVAFDKIKKEQDCIRDIFPKTMKCIDDYKSKNGYESFSNLLQKEESRIMIDGLLKYMFQNGYKYFPIHDACRVKKSQLNVIKNEVENYFNSIGFKCLLRDKKTSKEINFKYKGIYDITITITDDDKKTFIDAINHLKPHISETILIESGILDKWKINYLYNKWTSINNFYENKDQ